MSDEVGFCVACIDKRFDLLTADYLSKTQNAAELYLGTNAGAALCLGYKRYCKNICNKCSKKKTCDPNNADMALLKESTIKNIDISLSLDNIKVIYMINHQDCGAIKAYLECSGYPQTLGENNKKDIEVNTELLLFASKYIKCKYPDIKPLLGLIDVNGAVANLVDGKWTVVYPSPLSPAEQNPLGLWYNYNH